VSKKPVRRVPDEQAATIPQVNAAIEALTKGDAARLTAFAAVIWAGRTSLPDGRDGDDLLSTAMHLTLTGKRRWNPAKVPFPIFLLGTMRSLASHARKARLADLLQVALSEGDLETPEDRERPLDKISAAESNRVHSAPVSAVDQLLEEERQQAASAYISAFERYLDDDWEGVLVIQAWREGHDGAGVRDKLGLSITEYETIMKSLRRKAKRFRI
jgi:hypothetical protein